VVFGDVNVKLGEQVATSTGATFVKCDVTKYTDQIALFKAAHSKFGSIDHAVSVAAIYEPNGFFGTDIDLKTVEEVCIKSARDRRTSF
jgi:NAD(P)-dependent dehydrogenase (short-subunit alcohol dehydrogenase family)